MLDESHTMKTEDKAQVTACVIEIYEPPPLDVAQLELIDGVQRRGVRDGEVVVTVNSTQIGC